MALNTNPFIEGIDPSGTFGGYASVLLQLIRQAKPSSTYGMILFDNTAPDVTGANAWRKSCIWLDLTTPGTPTVNVYKEGGSPGWSNVQALIPPLTIKNSMISNPDPLDADKGISITKLSPIGGTANQLIRINGTATGFQFVSLASLVTSGSIPVGSLITTGIPAGQLRFAGVVGPGTATWYDAKKIINALANAAIGSDLIAPAPSATSRSQFLTTRTGDPFAAWRYFDPAVDLLANTLNGDRLLNNSVPITKIIPSTGQSMLVTSGGVVDWIPIPPVTTSFITDDTALGTYVDTAGSSTTLNHTLGAMPLMFRVVLRCETNDGGYINGDEIDAQELALEPGSNFTTAFMFYVTSTFVKVTKTYGGHVVIRDKGTGAYHAINVPNRWRLRLYAMKVV
jgi:hypothetical protein